MGSSRKVDAMDCETQLPLSMSLSEWVTYYNDPEKEKLLNVISLEISRTKLGKLIRAPDVVRQVSVFFLLWLA